MPLITILFWLGVAVQAVTFIELLRRQMAGKLFCFAVMLGAMIAHNIVLGLNFSNPERYIAIQSTMAPLMAAIHIVATCEAAWWLITSLVNFRRQGIALFAFATMAVVTVERWCGVPHSDFLQRLHSMKRGLGFGLGGTILLALVTFKLLGAPGAPLWHGCALAMLSMGQAIGWWMRDPFQGNYIIVDSVIAGLLLWCAMVNQTPTWERLEPRPYDREGHERRWRALDRENRRQLAQE